MQDRTRPQRRPTESHGAAGLGGQNDRQRRPRNPQSANGDETLALFGTRFAWSRRSRGSAVAKDRRRDSPPGDDRASLSGVRPPPRPAIEVDNLGGGFSPIPWSLPDRCCRKRTFESSAPAIWRSRLGDREQSIQVFSNLFHNAAQSMQTGGELTIAATLDKIVGVAENVAVVRIDDTGSGVRPEDQERMFEPFFDPRGWDGAGIVHFRLDHRTASRPPLFGRPPRRKEARSSCSFRRAGEMHEHEDTRHR